MKFHQRIALPCLAIALAAAATAAQARVARITIDKVDALSDGSGYEVLRGRAFGTLDPAAAGNALITDIEFAPRNAQGQVEYVTTFSLHKPVDMAKASGVLWYELVNRAGPLRTFDSMASSGHVTLMNGWQGDIAPTAANYTVQVPVARNADGSPITGMVLARLADVPAGSASRPLAMLANAIPYDAASLDTSQARLVTKRSEKRSGESAGIEVVPASDWAFADCGSTPFPGKPHPRMICLRNGFDPKLLYEVAYRAKDPLVLGIGLAAIRDLASFFRYEARDSAGTANPVAGAMKWALGHGTSQSGNALKTFLLQGFNQDEAGRIVFDGANPHIAGRLTAVNVRFGLPSGSGTLYEPGGEGVLWWTPYRDAARGRTMASLLDRCRASKTCPKIFETFGSTEFNARLMTVALTGTDGKADLPLPADVRRYYFPGTTHGGDDIGGFDHASGALAACVLARNPVPEKEQMAALAHALVQWVTRGVEPPPSSYPRLADHQLAANNARAMGWPAIANAPGPDGMAVGLMQYDYGADLNANEFRGVLSQWPPAIRQTIPSLMPKLDADGNETAGLPAVQHQAPLGTYTGWNVTKAGFFQGQPCGGGLAGGYIPFSKTRAERVAANDPRLSLEERYGTQQGYLCVVRKAADREVARRLLLPNDAQKLLEQAGAASVLPATAPNPEAAAVVARLCG
ncbi:MAG: hypothetical protein JWQ07_3200 [Ramlibacter sp.]|nr:hypothetical protein [Ramlibacter sp.]